MARVTRVLGGLAVLIALVWSAGCSTTRVDILGDAMSPTLKNGEKVAATRAFDDVKRGDIVVFKYPNDETKSFVKRIVGVPGDRIESAAGTVSINGKVINEAYVLPENQSSDTWGAIEIPAGRYFVMGDNRRNSSDSRHWGTVTRGAIWAKVGDR